MLFPCQTERFLSKDVLLAMDIKREPPKKRGKYILIGVGVAVLGITTFMLSNIEARAPSVVRATLWIDSVQRCHVGSCRGATGPTWGHRHPIDASARAQ